MNSDSDNCRYRRVLYKLSGEILGGSHGIGFDEATVDRIVGELITVAEQGVEVGVVIGGGNFFRGAADTGLSISRVRSDQMGMLCTVVNAIALEQVVCTKGARAIAQSTVAVPGMVEDYNGTSCLPYLADGFIVIFAGGTGNTHVTTDTAASLRAIEVNADILLKATKVDGIYSQNPVGDDTAEMYMHLTHDEVLEKRLAVMDATSVVICREYNLPIRVFNASKEGAIIRAGSGVGEGTLVSTEKHDD